MTSSVKINESELIAFKDSQQADPVLKELLALPDVELKGWDFGISPQGILVKVEGNKQRPVVPRDMGHKILQENHDILTVGHMGIQWTVDLVKQTYWSRVL